MRRILLPLSILVLLLWSACSMPQVKIVSQAQPSPTPEADGQCTGGNPSLPPAIFTPAPTPASTATEISRPIPSPPLPAPAACPDVGEQRIVQVYKDVGPSVVHITTRVIEYSFFYGPIPAEGAGSGFLWDKAGHIVTNYHVIEGAQSIEVSFGEEEILEAQVVGIDPPNDLAVLQVDHVPPQITPLSERLGDSDTLQVGQRAIAIGNPFGRFDRTLTAGVISALNRTLEVEEHRRLRKAIQTDAAINRGNSGGPLLDGNGRLIGVNTAIFSPTGTSAGIGFAIPVNTVKRVVPVLIQLGRYPHPWLGAEGYDITPYLAHVLRLPVKQGLLVVRVYRSGPAYKAGLRGAQKQVIVGNSLIFAGGDIITQVDNQPVRTWDELNDYLELEKQVGDVVDLTIIRDNTSMHLRVQLEEAP